MIFRNIQRREFSSAFEFESEIFLNFGVRFGVVLFNTDFGVAKFGRYLSIFFICVIRNDSLSLGSGEHSRAAERGHAAEGRSEHAATRVGLPRSDADAADASDAEHRAQCRGRHAGE